MLTIKNTDSFNLQGQYPFGNTLTMQLVRCKPSTSPVPCAEESEIRQYISQLILFFGSIESFVDYEDVEPGIGPIKSYL